MNKRLTLVSFFCLAGTFLLFSQQEKSTTIYGFVRSDFFFDSRSNKTSSQELFSYYPMYSKLNTNGDDLNAVPNAGLNSITTRLGLNINGRGIWGATGSQATIESDFCGAPSYWVVRLRQAYVKLKWNTSELLIGQTWHPLSTYSAMPNVLSLNTGSPFQPFNRSPQIRWDHQTGSLKWTASGIWQMMYTSNGPLGSAMTYHRNALMPDLYVSAEYKKGEWLTGLGLDYKCILPERYITNTSNVQVINNKRLYTPTLMAYALYSKPSFSIRGKALLGQNLADHSLIGGYAITPTHEYVAYNTFSSYLNVITGQKHQVGLFAGYSANLGPDSSLPAGSHFYGFGVEDANLPSERMVNSLYRLAPSYTYNYENWKVGVELEITAANWATRQTDGKLDTYETLTNHRLYGVVTYRF